jgi:segregation and condensation protein A
VSYTAKLLNFEGPLDLLLQLIESSKLEITEVTLSSVTTQYLGYIEDLQDPAPAELHSFLDLASKLIYLKSVALLPTLATPEQDEELAGLAEQLENYKHYVAAAGYLQSMIASSRSSYIRPTGDRLPAERLPLPELDLAVLGTILREEMQDREARQPRRQPASQAEQMSLAEACAQINEHVAGGTKRSVRDFFRQAPDRSTALVLFLAILELIKQGRLLAHQPAAHQEIMIYHEIPQAATAS